MTRTDANKIARVLKDASRILLTAHRDPDGDSIGCQLAFYEYWTRQRKKKADVINHGVLPRKYAFLDPRGVIQSPTRYRGRRRWDAVVVFECSTLPRIGKVRDLIPDGVPVINIDHHHHNTRFGTVNVLDEDAAACGEMIYDLLSYWKARLTPDISRQLAAAIITDTGRFHYRGTTPRTLEVTAELMRHGVDLTSLTDAIYYSYPPTHYRLMQHVLGNARLFADGRICLLSLSEADRRRFGVPLRELEGLVDYTLYLRGVRIGALLKEIAGNRTKVSLRSTGSLNVAEIARRFDGGGHPNAAGLVMDMPMAQAMKTLARQIRPLLPKAGTRHVD